MAQEIIPPMTTSFPTSCFNSLIVSQTMLTRSRLRIGPLSFQRVVDVTSAVNSFAKLNAAFFTCGRRIRYFPGNQFPHPMLQLRHINPMAQTADGKPVNLNVLAVAFAIFPRRDGLRGTTILRFQFLPM